MPLPGKMFPIPSLVLWKEITPCKATVQQIAEFFLYLHQELKLSIPVIKGCSSARNELFTLTGMHLAADRVISSMFSSFKTSLWRYNAKQSDCQSCLK